MTTARSKQGVAILSDDESTFGTTDALKDSYIEGLPTTWPERQNLAIQVNTVHEHAAEFTEPVLHSPARENAIVVKAFPHQAASTSGTADMAKWFKSAGCDVTTGSGTTVATYTSTTEWTLTADASTDAGAGVLELNDGTLWPVLVADYTSGTKTVVPSMAIPSASLATNAWYSAHCISPQTVETTSWITWQSIDRRVHTTNPGYAITANGCALASVGEWTIERNQLPFMDLTFHAAKITESASALSSHNESYNDSPNKLVVNDNFLCGFASASAAGGIARTNLNIVRARINFGLSTQMIGASGDGNAVGGIQGYMGMIDPAAVRVILEVVFDKAQITAWDASGGASGQTAKYIDLVQPSTSASTPCWGFYAPNCYQIAEPLVEPFGGDESFYKVTLTYRPAPAGYNSEVDNTDTGAAPWFLVIPQWATS